MFLKRSLVSLAIGASLLTISGCGLNDARSTTSNGRLAAAQSKRSRQVVTLRFRDTAQLSRLDDADVDLFENVDLAARTVDAAVSEAGIRKLRAKGISVTRSIHADAYEAFAFPAGYHTVAQIQSELQQLAADHAAVMKVQEIGKSVQGRPLVAVCLSSKAGSGLPALLVSSGHHARELPPVELTMRYIRTMAEGYGKDPVITRLLDTREVWVMPLVNPDGRSRVEGGDSMWRKNVRPNANGSTGVDTNRNADDHFEDGDRNPSSDAYQGTAPFSEPETAAIRNLCERIPFKVALDIHCYGGMILWPPGYDRSVTPDDRTFRVIGTRLAKGGKYRAGTIAQTIYQTFGDVATWQYSKKKILAFAAELDDGRFNPPYRQVDTDWSIWQDNLMYLTDVTGNLPNP